MGEVRGIKSTHTLMSSEKCVELLNHCIPEANKILDVNFM